MKKVYVFLGINFSITWALCLFVYLQGGQIFGLYTLLLAVCMMVPAISVLITKMILKDRIPIWIKFNFKGNWKYYLIAWFGPFILILVGAIVYFIIFPSQLDLGMQNYIDSTMDYIKQNGGTEANLMTPEILRMTYYVQMVVGLLIAPLINLIPTLGEEIGWRGYLLPRLSEHYSLLKSTIITGIIWGVWHAPMIAMGHNYGVDYAFAPWGGIFSMIIFCIFAGAILSYLAIHVKSAIPAAIAHGVINGMAAMSIVFMTSSKINPFVGPLPVGIIGGIGFIIAGIAAMYSISKMDRAMLLSIDIEVDKRVIL